MESPLLVLRSLPPSAIRRVAWSRGAPADSARVDVSRMLWQEAPPREDEALARFSLLTRSRAGDDVERVDEETDELDMRRFEAMHSGRGALGEEGAQQAVPEPGSRIAGRDPGSGQLMLMTVIEVDAKARIVVAEDGDETLEAADREQFELPFADVFVLPARDGPPTQPILPGTRVLAQFPGTTSFYPATVYKALRRTAVKGGRAQLCDYYLQFDDDEEGDDGEIIPKKVKGELCIAAGDVQGFAGGGGGDVDMM